MKGLLLTILLIFFLIVAGIVVISRMDLMLEGKNMPSAQAEAFYSYAPQQYFSFSGSGQSGPNQTSGRFKRNSHFKKSIRPGRTSPWAFSGFNPINSVEPASNNLSPLPTVNSSLPPSEAALSASDSSSSPESPSSSGTNYSSPYYSPVISSGPQEIIVPLFPISGSNESGSAIISSTGPDSSRVTIHLKNYIPANVQPAFIQTGNCSEPGGIAHNLVAANNGFSQTNLDVPLFAFFESPMSVNVQRSRAEAFITEVCGDI